MATFPQKPEGREVLGDCATILFGGALAALLVLWWLYEWVGKGEQTFLFWLLTAGEAVLAVYAMLVIAWRNGAKEGWKLAESTWSAVTEREKEAIGQVALANEQAATARNETNAALAERRIAQEQAECARQERDAAEQKRQEAIQHASIELRHARNLRAVTKVRQGTSDVAFLEAAATLGLRDRLSVSVRVGKHIGESQEDYLRRRDQTLRSRERAWKRTGYRYGHKVLAIMDEQMGICGNPRKDPNGKGCGCDLYALLPTSVHLDHVLPQNKGGGDEHANIQALCITCNTRAGDKTE